DAQAAIARARQMVADGADLIDLGAESTRPGAQPVSADEEIARLLPVLEGLRDLAIPVSVDTRHAATMRAALQAGAAIINDISALEDDPGSLAAVAGAQCPVVLMHKQGDPQTMQVAPRYDDVVAEVHDYLAGRIKACEAAGIARQRIILDPGIGFGKTLEHNLALLRDGLAALRNLGCALLVGVSRKSMIGALTGERDPARRVAGSLAAGLRAVQQGAHILRVHDVPETVHALRGRRRTAGGTSPSPSPHSTSPWVPAETYSLHRPARAGQWPLALRARGTDFRASVTTRNKAGFSAAIPAAAGFCRAAFCGIVRPDFPSTDFESHGTQILRHRRHPRAGQYRADDAGHGPARRHGGRRLLHPRRPSPSRADRQGYAAVGLYARA